jgi:hypothetical protein
MMSGVTLTQLYQLPHSNGDFQGSRRHRQLALFPADREVPECAEGYGVQVRLDAMELHRPPQWGACWLACQLYKQLEFDQFWSTHLVVRAGLALARLASPTIIW